MVASSLAQPYSATSCSTSLPYSAASHSRLERKAKYFVRLVATGATTVDTPVERDDCYDAALDLALVDDTDRIVAFAVSYLHGEVGEIGTVGVIPDQKGRGLSMVVVAAALDRLVAAGATRAARVTMSTSGSNAPMLATARRAGVTEVRRTTWWHLASID